MGCNLEQVFAIPTLTLNIFTCITDSTIHNLSFPIITFFFFRNSLCHFLRLVVQLYCSQHKNTPRFFNYIFFVQLSNYLHIIPLLVELRTIQNYFPHRASLNFNLILPRSRTGTVWFYTSTSNKRAARPKLYTKSLTGDLKLMYSRFTLVTISINL